MSDKYRTNARARFGYLKIGLIALFIVLVTAAIFRLADQHKASRSDNNAPIPEFASCVSAGNPVTESYPRQCTDKSGNIYREGLE